MSVTAPAHTGEPKVGLVPRHMRQSAQADKAGRFGGKTSNSTALAVWAPEPTVAMVTEELRRRLKTVKEERRRRVQIPLLAIGLTVALAVATDVLVELNGWFVVTGLF